MEFPQKVPLFLPIFTDFLGKMRLTLYFWPILAEFFIPSGNMFILRNLQLDFFEKCKNGLKNGVLPKTKPTFFAYFYSFFRFPNRDFTRRFLRRVQETSLPPKDSRVLGTNEDTDQHFLGAYNVLETFRKSQIVQTFF